MHLNENTLYPKPFLYNPPEQKALPAPLRFGSKIVKYFKGGWSNISNRISLDFLRARLGSNISADGRWEPKKTYENSVGFARHCIKDRAGMYADVVDDAAKLLEFFEQAEKKIYNFKPKDEEAYKAVMVALRKSNKVHDASTDQCDFWHAAERELSVASSGKFIGKKMKKFREKYFRSMEFSEQKKKVDDQNPNSLGVDLRMLYAMKRTTNRYIKIKTSLLENLINYEFEEEILEIEDHNFQVRDSIRQLDSDYSRTIGRMTIGTHGFANRPISPAENEKLLRNKDYTVGIIDYRVGDRDIHPHEADLVSANSHYSAMNRHRSTAEGLFRDYGYGLPNVIIPQIPEPSASRSGASNSSQEIRSKDKYDLVSRDLREAQAVLQEVVDELKLKNCDKLLTEVEKFISTPSSPNDSIFDVIGRQIKYKEFILEKAKFLQEKYKNKLELKLDENEIKTKNSEYRYNLSAKLNYRFQQLKVNVESKARNQEFSVLFSRINEFIDTDGDASTAEKALNCLTVIEYIRIVQGKVLDPEHSPMTTKQLEEELSSPLKSLELKSFGSSHTAPDEDALRVMPPTNQEACHRGEENKLVSEIEKLKTLLKKKKFNRYAGDLLNSMASLERNRSMLSITTLSNATNEIEARYREIDKLPVNAVDVDEPLFKTLSVDVGVIPESR